MGPSIRQDILRRSEDLDVPLAGFAMAGAWDDPPFEPRVPEAFRPRAIWPEARTVVVIGSQSSSPSGRPPLLLPIK